MDPVSPLPAVACLLTAIATAYILSKQFGSPSVHGRFASIDGLRGYLAFFVFLHHSCIWYFYLRTGRWTTPPSNLYAHFGQSSVMLFFMITGFLFFSKLIDGRTRTIDWGKLFVSRFLRLVPLYVFAMLLLFIVVAFVSRGVLNETMPGLLKGAASWLGFTILGAPNLNGVGYTFTIVAGVTWSLPYEWLFYFSLPLLALTVWVIPPLPYIALSLAGVAAIIIWDPQIHPMILMPFLGGMAAALFVRLEPVRRFASGKIATLIIIGCTTVAVAFYATAYGVIPLILLTVAFVLIACGNDLFGALVSPVSRILGEMAYSIYLLHGITLFVTFNFILGPSGSALSSAAHWLLIVMLTPFLITICFFTFRYIENPAMRSTASFTAWLRQRLTFPAKVNAPG